MTLDQAIDAGATWHESGLFADQWRIGEDDTERPVLEWFCRNCGAPGAHPTDGCKTCGFGEIDADDFDETNPEDPA